MVIKMRYTIYNKENKKIFESDDSMKVYCYHMENKNIVCKIETNDKYVITTFKNGNKEYMKKDTYRI
jgi:hypothetical protein